MYWFLKRELYSPMLLLYLLLPYQVQFQKAEKQAKEFTGMLIMITL
jgi:hypothetical protein